MNIKLTASIDPRIFATCFGIPRIVRGNTIKILYTVVISVVKLWATPTMAKTISDPNPGAGISESKASCEELEDSC